MDQQVSPSRSSHLTSDPLDLSASLHSNKTSHNNISPSKEILIKQCNHNFFLITLLVEEKAQQMYDIVKKDGREDLTLRLIRHFNESKNQDPLQNAETVSLNLNDPIILKQKIMEGAFTELYERFKKYTRVKDKVDRYKNESVKLNKQMSALAKNKFACDSSSTSSIKIAQTKLDVGIMNGSISSNKSRDCLEVIGSSSIFYVVTHGSKQIFTSQKYHVPKRDRQNSILPVISPSWNEFFTLSLTGDLEESLIFEVYRHNSCEGDLQIDYFEVRLQEDPMFFDLLTDQAVHYLTYHSSQAQNQQQSPNHIDESSKFKVLLKWKHTDGPLKIAMLKKKLLQIQQFLGQEELAMKELRYKYDNLMLFKGFDAMKLLDVWGIEKAPPKPRFIQKKESFQQESLNKSINESLNQSFRTNQPTLKVQIILNTTLNKSPIKKSNSPNKLGQSQRISNSRTSQVLNNGLNDLKSSKAANPKHSFHQMTIQDLLKTQQQTFSQKSRQKNAQQLGVAVNNKKEKNNTIIHDKQDILDRAFGSFQSQQPSRGNLLEQTAQIPKRSPINKKSIVPLKLKDQVAKGFNSTKIVDRRSRMSVNNGPSQSFNNINISSACEYNRSSRLEVNPSPNRGLQSQRDLSLNKDIDPNVNKHHYSSVKSHKSGASSNKRKTSIGKYEGSSNGGVPSINLHVDPRIFSIPEPILFEKEAEKVKTIARQQRKSGILPFQSAQLSPEQNSFVQTQDPQTTKNIVSDFYYEPQHPKIENSPRMKKSHDKFEEIEDAQNFIDGYDIDEEFKVENPKNDIPDILEQEHILSQEKDEEFSEDDSQKDNISFHSLVNESNQELGSQLQIQQNSSADQEYFNEQNVKVISIKLQVEQDPIIDEHIDEKLMPIQQELMVPVQADIISAQTPKKIIQKQFSDIYEEPEFALESQPSQQSEIISVSEIDSNILKIEQDLNELSLKYNSSLIVNRIEKLNENTEEKIEEVNIESEITVELQEAQQIIDDVKIEQQLAIYDLIQMSSEAHDQESFNNVSIDSQDKQTNEIDVNDDVVKLKETILIIEEDIIQNHVESPLIYTLQDMNEEGKVDLTDHDISNEIIQEQNTLLPIYSQEIKEIQHQNSDQALNNASQEIIPDVEIQTVIDDEQNTDKIIFEDLLLNSEEQINDEEFKEQQIESQNILLPTQQIEAIQQINDNEPHQDKDLESSCDIQSNECNEEIKAGQVIIDEKQNQIEEIQIVESVLEDLNDQQVQEDVYTSQNLYQTKENQIEPLPCVEQESNDEQPITNIIEDGNHTPKFDEDSHPLILDQPLLFASPQLQEQVIDEVLIANEDFGYYEQESQEVHEIKERALSLQIDEPEYEEQIRASMITNQIQQSIDQTLLPEEIIVENKSQEIEKQIVDETDRNLVQDSNEINVQEIIDTCDNIDYELDNSLQQQIEQLLSQIEDLDKIEVAYVELKRQPEINSSKEISENKQQFESEILITIQSEQLLVNKGIQIDIDEIKNQLNSKSLINTAIQINGSIDNKIPQILSSLIEQQFKTIQEFLPILSPQLSEQQHKTEILSERTKLNQELYPTQYKIVTSLIAFIDQIQIPTVPQSEENIQQVIENIKILINQLTDEYQMNLDIWKNEILQNISIGKITCLPEFEFIQQFNEDHFEVTIPIDDNISSVEVLEPVENQSNVVSLVEIEDIIPENQYEREQKEFAFVEESKIEIEQEDNLIKEEVDEQYKNIEQEEQTKIIEQQDKQESLEDQYQTVVSQNKNNQEEIVTQTEEQMPEEQVLIQQIISKPVFEEILQIQNEVTEDFVMNQKQEFIPEDVSEPPIIEQISIQSQDILDQNIIDESQPIRVQKQLQILEQTDFIPEKEDIREQNPIEIEENDQQIQVSPINEIINQEIDQSQKELQIVDKPQVIEIPKIQEQVQSISGSSDDSRQIKSEQMDKQVIDTQVTDQMNCAPFYDKVSMDEVHDQHHIEEEEVVQPVTLTVQRDRRMKASSNMRHIQAEQQQLKVDTIQSLAMVSEIEPGIIQGEIVFHEARNINDIQLENTVPFEKQLIQSQKLQPTLTQDEVVEEIKEQPISDSPIQQNKEIIISDKEDSEELEPFVFISDLPPKNNNEDIPVIEEAMINLPETFVDELSTSILKIEEDIIDDSLVQIDEEEKDFENYSHEKEVDDDQVILQPTMQNMKRMELKSRRKDIDGTLATSNIMDILGKYQAQQPLDQTIEEMPQLQHFNSIQPSHTFLTSTQPAPRLSMRGLGPNGLGMSFGGSHRFTVTNSKPNGTRSVFQDPQQNEKLQHSVYSGLSGGSRIGMLMKGLDTGAMFTRQALKKDQQVSASQTSSNGGGGVLKFADDLNSHRSKESHTSSHAYGNSPSESIGDQPKHQTNTDYYKTNTPTRFEPIPETDEQSKQRLGHMFMSTTTMPFGLYGAMMNSMDIWVILASLKLVLFHAYKSTDFEVHRNWMAIAYSLPLKEWYYEHTSLWTLDYPPFFAYFEWILSQIASLIDINMLKVENLDYSEQSVVFYQRGTVIVSDIVFLYGVFRYFQAEAQAGKVDIKRIAFNYGSAALLLLDNIHFQYNSMMYGLMLIVIALIKEKSYIKSALVYAILLNFKHIYLYCAPCFGILYLKKAVFKQSFGKGLFNFMLLGLQTVLIFAISFGPFIYIGGIDQLKQIASRLFPFTRGLVHSYWAANAWGLYVFYNKYIVNIYQGITTGKKIQCIYDADNAQDLATYKSWSLITTMIFLIPVILVMFRHLNRKNFNFYLAATNFIVFNFGFHVHEKAILMTIIPLMQTHSINLYRLDVHANSNSYSKIRLLILKTIALWTLLPLLISPNETLVKHMILFIDFILTVYIFLKLNISKESLIKRMFVYSMIASIIIVQFCQVVIVEIYLKRHEGWMHRYQDILPTIANIFNQIIFIEMMYTCIARPKSIGQQIKKKKQ